MAGKKSRKSAKTSARKPAKKSARAAAKPARTAAKSGASDIVYSDVRRDALAWQLKKLR